MKRLDGKEMVQRLSGVLICGSSHVGKTTLAGRLAEALGWNPISTDSLARHPGRPWSAAPLPVIEYYSRLSPEAIHWFLKVHHENMWPGIRQKIEAEIKARKPFLFEGAALRPEYIAPYISTRCEGILLHADGAFLRDRMRSEAGYEKSDEATRYIIDKFIDRSLRDNSEMYAAARQSGLRLVDASDRPAMAGLFTELVDRALLP